MSLANINTKAKELRASDPKKYGIHGSKAGQPGYVLGGWALAQKDARTALGKPESKPKAPSAPDAPGEVKKPRAKKAPAPSAPSVKLSNVTKYANQLQEDNPDVDWDVCLAEAKKKYAKSP